MAYFPAITLSANENSLNISQFGNFEKTAYGELECLLSLAPSDSVLTAEVVRQRGEYKIVIKLVSQILQLFEIGTGRSPYVALEKAVLRARDSVRLWSIKKTV